MQKISMNKKIVIAIILIFVLGIVMAISNAYCAVNIGHLFAPLMYTVALISLAIGGTITFIFAWKIDQIQLEKVISILPDEERKVLKIIINEKKITQTELKIVSGLSKVKVSRIVSKLEQRKIIEKKPYGNTNLIIKQI